MIRLFIIMILMFPQVYGTDARAILAKVENILHPGDSGLQYTWGQLLKMLSYDILTNYGPYDDHYYYTQWDEKVKKHVKSIIDNYREDEKIFQKANHLLILLQVVREEVDVFYEKSPEIILKGESFEKTLQHMDICIEIIYGAKFEPDKKYNPGLSKANNSVKAAKFNLIGKQLHALFFYLQTQTTLEDVATIENIKDKFKWALAAKMVNKRMIKFYRKIFEIKKLELQFSSDTKNNKNAKKYAEAVKSVNSNSIFQPYHYTTIKEYATERSKDVFSGTKHNQLYEDIINRPEKSKRESVEGEEFLQNIRKKKDD